MPAAVAVCLILAGVVPQHGAMTRPRPRNAVDGDVPPWSGAVPTTKLGGLPFTGWCPFPDANSSHPLNLTGANGQACFWFSNGCGIGCDVCDGVTRGPIPVNLTGDCIDTFTSPPQYNGTRPCAKMPACAAPSKAVPASNCDPATRSINRGAACGSRTDYWYYSPWRAPGSAPVFDACGLAGGNYAANPTCSYVASPNAKMGAKGSDLPPGNRTSDAEQVWTAGSHVTVAWVINANQ
jgi:hypothetical protein